MKENYKKTQLNEIHRGKMQNIDTSFYENAQFSAKEMRIMRLYLVYGIEIPKTKRINTKCLNVIENILEKDIDVNVEKYFGNLEYNSDQIEQILLGLEKGLDVSIYENPKYDSNQMEQIRFGLLENLDVSIYATPEYNYEQMHKIHMGLKKEVDVTLYANPQLDSNQMALILQGLEDSLDVKKYNNPSFSFYQMCLIYTGLKANLDVDIYANPEFNYSQMKEIYEGLSTLKTSDVSIYAHIEISAAKMRQIRLAIKNGVDIQPYITNYNAKQLDVIRQGLQSHLDISRITIPSLSAKEMKRRLFL